MSNQLGEMLGIVIKLGHDQITTGKQCRCSSDDRAAGMITLC